MNDPGDGPSVVDLIRRGRCNLIVNTPDGGPEPRVDGYLIREAALDGARPVRDDDRGRDGGGARDRERAGGDGTVLAGAHRCRESRASVVGSSRSRRSARTRSCASSAGGIDPGVPGQFFMLEAPGRVLPRPMSLCLAPPGELAFLLDPIGPGTRALAALEPGDELAVFGPLGNGFRLDVRSSAARRRRHRRRAVAVPLGGARASACGARLPVRAPRRSGRARPERRGRDRPRARDRGAAGRARRARVRARTDARSGARARARTRSSPGRRRWPAATARATAASSRSTAS